MKRDIPVKKIEAFCNKWSVSRFSLFGSFLREDFRPDSDIDVLVAFEEGADWGMRDWLRMIDELQAIFKRRIDLVEEGTIRNPFRLKAIMTEREIVYAA